jgi:hypothetical protein
MLCNDMESNLNFEIAKSSLQLLFILYMHSLGNVIMAFKSLVELLYLSKYIKLVFL